MTDFSPEQLRSAIQEFITDYSVEMLPKHAELIPELATLISPKSLVYIANPPNSDFNLVVDVAIQLKAAGLDPVPHLLARETDDLDELKASLDRLTSAGLRRILLLAGDKDTPKGPYTSTLELLDTGVIQSFDLETIGVAGHPEGSPYAPNDVLDESLKTKNAVNEQIKAQMYVITQLAFEAKGVVKWVERMNAAGNKLPVHAGMAGPTKLSTLINYSRMCGVGASLKALTKKAGLVKNLLAESTADEMIVEFAKLHLQNPDHSIRKAHFFAFAGPKGTARWANAVIRGDFELSKDLTGFKVNS